MPSRYAKPISVPELKEKLRTLYQQCKNPDSDDALGRLFKSEEAPQGIRGTSIRYWISGDDSREANMVPADRLDRLVEIFQKRLPGNRTTAETRALLLSPSLRAFTDAFHADCSSANWLTIVRDARPGEIAILDCGRRGVMGLTSRGAPIRSGGGEIAFPFDHWFRFHVPRGNPAWLTVIQSSPAGWYGLELANSQGSIEQLNDEMSIPVTRPYFVEDEERVCTYLFIRTGVPLPLEVSSRIAISGAMPAPLDVTTLNSLAQFLSETRDFKVEVMDVRFINPDSGYL